jgi:hypothetical protein
MAQPKCTKTQSDRRLQLFFFWQQKANWRSATDDTLRVKRILYQC